MGWTKGKKRGPRRAPAAAPVDQAPVIGEASAPEPEVNTDGQEGEQLFIEMEDAPPDIFEPQKKSAMDYVRSALGLGTPAGEDEAEKKPAAGGRLTKRQQDFVATVSPGVAWVLIILSAWGWSKLGEEYRVLAPDKQVALNIMTPVVRIYARHAKWVSKVSPDTVDAAASLTALAGYVQTTIELYQAIKRGDLDEPSYHANQHGGWAEYDPASDEVPYESGYRGEHTGRNAVQRSHRQYPANVERIRPSNDVNQGSLSEEQRFQLARLSELRHRDLESRMRRSGRSNGFHTHAG